MTDPKPQPCPVCAGEGDGGSVCVHTDYDPSGDPQGYWVECDECELRSPVEASEWGAIRAWNRLRYVEET
jgi:hypothetical protein